MIQEYPCPCCGYLVFEEPPGSYGICPICFWEDDLVQLADPSYEGGANQASLLEAQDNFSEHGWCEQRVAPHVRPPAADDRRDPEWRPLDESRDRIGPTGEPKWLGQEPNLAVLYYWRERVA